MTIYGHENDENVWKDHQKERRPWEFALHFHMGGNQAVEVHGPTLLHTATCTETRGAVPGHLLQVMQGPMITLSFLNFISETLWKFQANSVHRSFFGGKMSSFISGLDPNLDSIYL